MNWIGKYLNDKRLRESEVDGHRDPSNDVRTPIESDFGRVIFSEACRRLHDKTQVFPLTNDDNIHSRLTHSLEVMNVGLSFALLLSKDKDFLEHSGLDENKVLHDVASVLKTSCLVHDIGNPPFGHFGEDSIQDYFKRLFELIADEIRRNEGLENERGDVRYEHVIIQSVVEGKDPVGRKAALDDLLGFCESDESLDFTQFDGNAQGFRVLTKLQYKNDLYGLNLTFASLAASLKYPNTKEKQEKEVGVDWIALHKHGVFATEADYLERVADACDLRMEDGGYKRHPLTFLMEAADSICYLIMDIEDAICKGWLDVNRVLAGLARTKDVEWLGSLTERLNKGLPERKRLMDLRTELFAYLISLAKTNFVKYLSEIEEGTYQNELIFDDENGVAKSLKELCDQWVLSQREIQSLEVTGNAVVSGLFDVYINLLFHKNKGFRKRGKALISKTIFMTVLHEHFPKEKCCG